MQNSIARLSLATALLMGAALPVFAQGVSGSTPAVVGPRAAIVTPAQATPAVSQSARPGPASPAHTGQSARPAHGVQAATPAQPGGSVVAPAPRQGVATNPGGTTQQQAATPARPAVPRAN